MAELYTIIQMIMKNQKKGNEVDVTLKNGDILTGIIADFSGQELSVDGTVVSVGDISFITEKVPFVISDYIMKRVVIVSDTDDVVDAVLVAADEKAISYITEDGQMSLMIENINKISCEGKVVFAKDAADTTKKEIGDSIELSDATNEFEKEILLGNKSVVNELILKNSYLVNLGYTEGEVDRIKRVFPASNWKHDLYSTATRLYLFLQNKNGLAKKYFDKVLETAKKGSEEYIKSIRMLEQIYFKYDKERYIDFWRNNANYLKSKLFYNNYINMLMQTNGINPFEKALINGNKMEVMELSSDESAMERMGYSSEEIDRICKALKVTSWDTTWYKTAARLFGVQLNRNGLAELFYEAALLISDKQGEEYAKILNALAPIKISKDSNEFITFFDTYRNKLKFNKNFCMAYAKALIKAQDWDRLMADLPMLREQLASMPDILANIEEEIDYYKSVPPFKLEEFPVISGRLAEEENLYDQEKVLIERLPDRNAVKALLDVYYFNKNEDAYFELLEYALFFIKDDYASMGKLREMLSTTDKENAFIDLMVRIPVFWCDSELIKKYLAICKKDDNEVTIPNNLSLDTHIKSFTYLHTPNGFERSIINRDYDALKNYINNHNLLEELGYSQAEIDDIMAADIEQQLSDDCYTMRRLLAFQGNKNHMAEHYLFEAFYINEIDMCNRLFPLLLSEKRGELILSLFEFDHTLKNKNASLKRFYYLALCIAEKDDEVFFKCMKNKWMDYQDDVILDRMLSVGKAHNNEFLVKRIETQKHKPRGNAFEMALIKADNETIRMYVKNAHLLVELGYTPEEIQKINKIFNQGNYSNGSRPGQIANRVFLYQNNKNNLAESLFLKAIVEDSPEDVITDYKSLFYIYMGQPKYEMVCDIFENHLMETMIAKFNETYAANYCIALYELERYQAFLAYYSLNRSRWEHFRMYAHLLYICEILDIHDYDNLIWDNIQLALSRPEIIARYIKASLGKDAERIYSDEIIYLINSCFAKFSLEDIEEIKSIVNGIDYKPLALPQGGLISAMIDEENCSTNLNEWFDYMCKTCDYNTFIELLIKLQSVFASAADVWVKRAITLYQNTDWENANVHRISSLEELIINNLHDQEDIIAWRNIQAGLLRSGKGSEKSLENYLSTCTSSDEQKEFWDVYLSFKQNAVSDMKPETLFGVVQNYYNSQLSVWDNNLKNDIVNEMIDLSGQFMLDYIGCKNMAAICAECKMDFESKIYLSASNRLIQQNGGTMVVSKDSNNYTVDFYNYLLEKLSEDTVDDLIKCFSGWTKYLSLSENESLIIARLSNTVNDAGLWVRNEVDVLAKAIIFDPTNIMYWKLLKAWVENNEDKNITVIGNIISHTASQGGRELEEALIYAIDNDLRELSLKLLLKMLNSEGYMVVVAAQKKLRSMIKKNWFMDSTFKTRIFDIFDSIHDSIPQGASSDFEWNSVGAATELAIATGEYDYFLNKYSDYLSKSCAKQCCVIIADMILKGNVNGIDAAFKHLDNAFIDIPYKNLVTDIYRNFQQRELADAEKQALKCIKSNYGNLLGINDLLEFYCDKMLANDRESGLETIKLFIKYTPYDPALFELAALFLRGEKGLDENEAYYNYMYDYVEYIHNYKYVRYVIGSMVCGENYLRLNGRNVRSFKKLIDTQYKNYSDSSSFSSLANKYQEFCDSIFVRFRTTEYADFAPIFIRAVFSGDWLSVFEYKSDNSALNTLIEQNIKREGFNAVSGCFRSVIREVALYALNRTNISDNALERARILWKNINKYGKGCDFDFFFNLVHGVDEVSAAELKAVFSLDIETLTVYKKFFGKCIISQANCCKYADIFAVFVNTVNGDIFNNYETQEYLKTIDIDRAKEICETYERLYIRAQTRDSYKEKILDKQSDYENNVFSGYLIRHLDNYFSIEQRWARFKRKYEFIKRLYHVTTFDNLNNINNYAGKKRQIFSIRSLYYYYSVLADMVDKEEFLEEYVVVDVINAITIALSDDTYLTVLSAFIAKFDADIKAILGVLIMIEQGKIDESVQLVLNKFSGDIQGYLCAKITRDYGADRKDEELCRKCHDIAVATDKSSYFWIRNIIKCKSIFQMDAKGHLEEKESIYGSRNDFEMKTGIVEVNNVSEDTPSIKNPVSSAVEEISMDVPSFISDFIKAEYEDKKMNEYQKEWKEAKEALDNGTGETGLLNNLSINIGICLLKKQKNKVNERIMCETFNLIRKNAIKQADLIAALHNIFQKYVNEYTDIDSLANSVYENKEAILHLCYEQNIDKESRVSEDINAVIIIVEELIEIATDLSSSMDEETKKWRLIEHKDKIINGARNISKFRNTLNKLGDMIQEKINRINSAPNLGIFHLSESNSNSWEETWLTGADKGHIRGIVINRGGDTAYNVELKVTVNSELRGIYSIDKISPGRTISFAVPYKKEDIVNNKVSWDTTVAFFEDNNTKKHTQNAQGEIKVLFSEEQWGITHVGREKFNCSTAAEGEEFCGRSYDLLRLESLYNINESPNKYPSLLITGLRRVGKSSMIKFFISKLKQRENVIPIYSDAQGIYGDIRKAFFEQSVAYVYACYGKKLKEQLDELADFKNRWDDIFKTVDWIDQLPAFFVELSELFGGKKIIFVLDEMENVFYANRFENVKQEEDFFGMFRFLIQNYQEYVSFIFLGSDMLLTSCLEQKRESQMFQVLQRIYIGRMDISDIREVFKKYNAQYDIKFGDDAIEAIMFYTQGLIWYTKIIAYHILDKIIDREHILRGLIHWADVNEIVELLIRGDLGAELIDLLDNNLSAKRKVILRSMARASINPYDSVNVDMILSEMNKSDFVDDVTGEVVGSISLDDLKYNLNILEKMDFIVKDTNREESYIFSTELYRLLMLSDKKIDKFVKIRS